MAVAPAAAEVVQDVPGGESAGVRLERLRGRSLVVDELQRAQVDAVVVLRAEGVTWDAIAGALGVTRQAAAERFRKALP